MSTYSTDLANLKHHALRTLYQVLQSATDPAELRRTATTILRIPDPKPDAHTPGMRRLCDESRGYPTHTMSESGNTSESRGCSTPAPVPGESHESPDPPAGESKGLIVSSRAVEQGSASDTPGTDTTSEPHSEGVLVAPEHGAHASLTAHSPSLPSTLQLIAHHPRPAAQLRAAAGAPRSLTTPDLPFFSAPMLPRSLCSPAP